MSPVHIKYNFRLVFNSCSHVHAAWYNEWHSSDPVFVKALRLFPRTLDANVMCPVSKNMIMHFCFLNWIIIKIFSLREKAYPLNNVKSFYFCCFAKCSKRRTSSVLLATNISAQLRNTVKRTTLLQFHKRKYSEIVTIYMNYKITCWKNMAFIKINSKRI